MKLESFITLNIKLKENFVNINEILVKVKKVCDMIKSRMEWLLARKDRDK